MRIDNLKLTNFRCFDEQSFVLRPNFNLVVGDNGKGKTSVLEAMSVAAGCVLYGFPNQYARERNIKPEEVHQTFYLQGQTLTVEPQFPCVVACEGVYHDTNGSWECAMRPDLTMDRDGANWLYFKSKDVIQKRVQAGQPIDLPVVSHYGTERLWLEAGNTTVNTLSPKSRFAGYQDCLNTASNQKRLIEWFKTQELAALQQKRQIAVLEACRNVILQCVPDAAHVYFDVTYDQLILDINGEGVPFSYLSDGYRNMLAMVADIAVKCATLNPHLEADAPAKTSGIVLIDEVDLHLHPKWQRRVVGDLLSSFPLIQFVATTHSPFVIQSLPIHEGVQLLNLDDEENRDFGDKSVEDIAEWVQGVELPQRSQRYVEMMERAQRYFQLIREDSGASEEEKQESRKALEKLVMPFSDSPAYHALLKMKELAAETKSNNANDDEQSPGGAAP